MQYPKPTFFFFSNPLESLCMLKPETIRVPITDRQPLLTKTQMLKLLQKLVHSTAFRIFLHALASLASAIVLISGFLVFMDLTKKNREDSAKDAEKIAKEKGQQQPPVEVEDET